MVACSHRTCRQIFLGGGLADIRIMMFVFSKLFRVAICSYAKEIGYYYQRYDSETKKAVEPFVHGDKFVGTSPKNTLLGEFYGQAVPGTGHITNSLLEELL